MSLRNESPFLKLWFEGSPADPRLNTATENLICLPLTGSSGKLQSMEDGKILVSDLGIRIDYGGLGIRQGDRPKDLKLTFRDGRERVLSCWDQEILEGFWLNGNILRDSPDTILWISFPERMDTENLESLTYAGKTFRK